MDRICENPNLLRHLYANIFFSTHMTQIFKILADG